MNGANMSIAGLRRDLPPQSEAGLVTPPDYSMPVEANCGWFSDYLPTWQAGCGFRQPSRESLSRLPSA